MRPLIFAMVVATAVAANVVLQEQKALPTPWRIAGSAEKDFSLTIMVQLHRQGQEALAQDVLARATPGSPRFRDWMTFAEAQNALKADSVGITVVEQWLRGTGLPFTSTRMKDQFQLQLTVAQAEQLFETSFNTVENPLTGQRVPQAGTLHAPAEVVPYIAFISGAHGLPLPPKTSKLGSPNVVVDVGPTEISKTYQVTGRGRQSKKIRQAVAEFQGQFMSQDDLTTFFKNLVPDAQSGDDTVYAYYGNNGTGHGVEALLDIEYIMGIAPGILTEFWAWRALNFCADLVSWTTLLLNTEDIPLVHSISYGIQDDPTTQLGCGNSEIKTIDDNFMTLAGRGITIIFASGDSGSGLTGQKLWPAWPASSPWVTSVGATCFTDTSATSQQASTQFGSGSGFSPMFDQASWQSQAVRAYLNSATGLPPDSYYPKGGRASADVSALGEGYKVYNRGRVEIVGGTSASAPCFAAVISLLNDNLDVSGKKQLGFLNPWLYNNTDMFTDITRGSDKISRAGLPLRYGFPCTQGWDPATGLGVPIFPKMKEKAMAN